MFVFCRTFLDLFSLKKFLIYLNFTIIQCFESVFITFIYAMTSYALQEAPANTCYSTFCVSVDFNLTHVSTNIDGKLKMESFHKFH